MFELFIKDNIPKMKSIKRNLLIIIYQLKGFTFLIQLVF